MLSSRQSLWSSVDQCRLGNVVGDPFADLVGNRVLLVSGRFPTLPPPVDLAFEEALRPPDLDRARKTAGSTT